MWKISLKRNTMNIRNVEKSSIVPHPFGMCENSYWKYLLLTVEGYEKGFISSTSFIVHVRFTLRWSLSNIRNIGKPSLIPESLLYKWENISKRISIHINVGKVTVSPLPLVTISTGDRPYNCKQCDKSFHFSYFTVHVIMHIGKETLWIYEMQ